MECTQVWGYDDLFEFQATQQDLSSQIGRTPALSFCPTCGIYLLDTGSTQALRDAHIQSCRDVEDPEGLEVVSEGEDSDDAADDTANVSESDKSEKRHKSQTGAEQDKACNQENSMAPTSAEMQATTPGGLQPQLAPHRPTGGILTEADSSAAAANSEQKHFVQVKDCIVCHGRVPACPRQKASIKPQVAQVYPPNIQLLMSQQL